MTRLFLMLFTLSLALASPVVASTKKNAKGTTTKKTKAAAKAEEIAIDFNKSTFKEILDRYVFIADFNQKPAERPITKEFIWKYPFKLPPPKFELDIEDLDLDAMVFAQRGQGRAVEVMNIGRVAFLAGEHQQAYDLWLNARQIFKDDPATAKILEYFMAINALAIYKKNYRIKDGDPDRVELKAYLQRAAYFFASTYILRRDIPNERIDKNAPWALYNLAAIYFRLDRIPNAFGAVEVGLAALLKQGKNAHRADFRRLLAECYIRNQDLLSAIQELDTGIRQDPNPVQAAIMLNRVGDIYYDLNNYELAEDMYAMAGAIDREKKNYNPAQALLRAESIFWLGRTKEAEYIFKIATDYALHIKSDDWLIKTNSLAWALLRIGDALLIRAQTEKPAARKELLEASRLAYFRVQLEFPRSEAAKTADIRGTCMEMPSYIGNNIRHARESLAKVKEEKSIPENLMELVWACDAGSYSDREKTDVMVSKIKEFSDKYPNSRYLESMLPPVKDAQASKIDEYFKKEQWEQATEFFENRRKMLYPKVSPDLAVKLWTAYVETGRSALAAEFWPQVRGQSPPNDYSQLRQAAFLFEMSSTKSRVKFNKDLVATNKKLGEWEWDPEPSTEEIDFLSRVLVSKDVALAYPWILNVQDAWTAGDELASCNVLFPFLSRINSDTKSPAKARAEVVKRTLEFGEAKITELKAKDATCFQSWLDLESKVLGVPAIDKIYKKRVDWALEGPWLERAWTWSEALYARGHRPEAVKVWQQIADNGPKDSFETRMAKSRLDPLKTEYEQLWK
jgi:tetratricopeptide (TPR) repeat protein